MVVGEEPPTPGRLNAVCGLGQDAGSADGAGLTLAFCAPLITASLMSATLMRLCNWKDSEPHITGQALPVLPALA